MLQRTEGGTCTDRQTKKDILAQPETPRFLYVNFSVIYIYWIVLIQYRYYTVHVSIHPKDGTEALSLPFSHAFELPVIFLTRFSLLVFVVYHAAALSTINALIFRCVTAALFMG